MRTLITWSAAACVLAACVTYALGADPAPPAAATAPPNLVAGVTSIASAGIPGPLGVFGERAFVVLGGKSGDGVALPLVAGAEWNKGRVIAFGHGGLIAGDALDHPGTRIIVSNAVRWLAPSGGKVGVVRNQKLRDTLVSAGFEATMLDGDWSASLAGLACVAVDSHQVSAKQRENLAAFVKGGGGLLTAGLAWGWLQLNPGRGIHEHPGNTLLREAGLGWCDGTLDAEKGEFRAEPPAPALHALEAIRMLEALASDADAPASPQVGETIASVLSIVPVDGQIPRRARAVLIAAKDIAAPTPERPLKRIKSRDRALVSLQVEMERLSAPADVRAHPSSRAFPGEVSGEAPRVDARVSVDRDQPGWQSTGLYAPPGEPIRIQGRGAGLRVRIGCHTDRLWHHDAWRRVPDISREWPLADGETTVASAFGGLVYIEAEKRGPGSADLAISGCVRSPRFVLGVTTPEEWAKSRAEPAPWGELQSTKVIVSVPSAVLRTLENPGEVMAFWDRISDAHAHLATIPSTPPRPHRFVADVAISAGYMHSGYPIMTHLDAAPRMVSLDALKKGDWGLLHELGHNHQEADWTFDGTGEVTCNLFALHAIDTICSPPEGSRGHRGVDAPPSLGPFLAAGAPFETWKRDPFLALHMYVQLQREFGWETFRKVFAEYRSLPQVQRPRSDAEKRDQWMVRFSRAGGRNLGPFFVAWGVPTSEAARASIADLPPWMPPDWPAKPTP